MSKHSEYREQSDKKLFDFMGISHPYSRPPDKHARETDLTKIVTISDPHEPYADRRPFDECERLHKDAETLVITGDVGDYYSKSRFKKTRLQSFASELRSVFFRLEWAATHFKRVEVMIGNHDNRPEKQISSLFQGHEELMIMTEQNLLAYMASYFDNVEVVGTQLDLLGIDELITGTMTHIYQRGDIVFTHAERANANRVVLMQNISKYLRDWSQVLCLQPYTVIAQAHNHTDLKMSMGVEKWFLMPCAMTTKSVGAEYIFSSKMYGTPPNVGYSLFFQEGGHTDYNRSGNVLL